MSTSWNGLVTELYTRHHRPLVAHLTRMTRCSQRAEDLAQTAWVKLLGAWSRGACAGLEERELRAYLYTIARHTFLDECTRKHATVRTCCVEPAMIEVLAGPEGTGMTPEEVLERQQYTTSLRQAIDTLPAEQRCVILLWMRGTSIRDMAATCRAPTDTVLSRKKYGFARLRARLAAQAPAPS
ncbi:MAG: RNA polymerase sigma factor [Gammaproteobacteria bacterium]|nr:RNA polymerase sigma factor [Gammaproteobacteria bacterium]